MPRTRKPPGSKVYFDAMRKVFALQSEVLTAALPHLGERGRNDEERIREFLRQTLPRKFGVGTGFVVCSDATTQPSPQLDVVVYDELHNAPLHRELTSYVFPIEMVYATVEVKGALARGDLAACVRSNAAVRAQAPHKRYVTPALAMVSQDRPGEHFAAEVVTTYDLAPRAYLVAYDVRGWRNIEAFARSWTDAIAEHKAHFHGIAVLSRDWYLGQRAFIDQVEFKAHTGSALLRFHSALLRAIQGMYMAPAARHLYLNL
jgi:hypothetical protein